MASSVSGAKLLSAVVTKAIIRGFSSSAAAAPKATPGNTVSSVAAAMVKKTGEAAATTTTKVSSSWVPDPRTGFYRPGNVAEEIDAAQLRALLLKKH